MDLTPELRSFDLNESQQISQNIKNNYTFVVLFLVVVLDFSSLDILHLQYRFIFLCGSGLQCFLPSLPSSIQSLLDYGKADGRPYVLFHLHYITSCCVAAQVLYRLSCPFLYVKALYAYIWESKNIFHSPSFVLPTSQLSFFQQLVI